MPLHPKISCNSDNFIALQENNLDYIKDNFESFESLKDYWLTVASCYSNLSVNEFFVSKGANPNFNNTENFTNAIFQNDLEVVKFYASHNCILLNNDNDHLGGAIMGAIGNNNVEMLKYLIDLGCNIHLDNDYAFNRGIAENSFECIRYLVENFQMSYNPTIDYNIQKIIQDNSYSILDYILNLIPKPLNFDFSNDLQHLFSKGHPEIFDLFVYYGFINEENFIQHFQSILYYLPAQIVLFNHLKNNYSEWFDKAQNKDIDVSKVKTIIDFVVSQKYSNETTHSLDFENLELLKNVVFIKKFIEQQPYFISETLLKNINHKNNMELLEYSYQSEFIKQNSIQVVLNEVLPQVVEQSYFSDLLNIVFKEPFETSFSNLVKIYSYFKLDNSMQRKLKNKLSKI